MATEDAIRTLATGLEENTRALRDLLQLLQRSPGPSAGTVSGGLVGTTAAGSQSALGSTAPGAFWSDKPKGGDAQGAGLSAIRQALSSAGASGASGLLGGLAVGGIAGLGIATVGVAGHAFGAVQRVGQEEMSEELRAPIGSSQKEIAARGEYGSKKAVLELENSTWFNPQKLIYGNMFNEREIEDKRALEAQEHERRAPLEAAREATRRRFEPAIRASGPNIFNNKAFMDNVQDFMDYQADVNSNVFQWERVAHGLERSVRLVPNGSTGRQHH